MATKDNTIYDSDSIQSLSPREHVRLRSGMYIGSTKDPTQLIVEIFSNALDEHNLGHGDLIQVQVDTKSGKCRVNDFGQGFPVNEMREDGKTILQAAFDEMNTSGKYAEDGVYGGTSLGLNGVGGKATNFLSKNFHVITFRDKKYEELDFIDGVLSSRHHGSVAHDSGTHISFTPDPQFFENPLPDVNYLRKLFNDICGMCPKLTIEFCVDGDIQTIHHADGMRYLVSESIGKANSIATPFTFHEKSGKYSVDCGIGYCSRDSASIGAYVNYGLTEQGPHITSVKTTLTKELNKWAREQGILKSKDKNLDGDSLQEGLVLVFNLVAPSISYDSQTKSRIVNKDFVPFLNDVFSQQIEVWLDNDPDGGRAIIEKALLARRASEAAKKARDAVKQQRQKQKKNKILHPDKLKDAEFLGEESTLLVVEGE